MHTKIDLVIISNDGVRCGEWLDPLLAYLYTHTLGKFVTVVGRVTAVH